MAISHCYWHLVVKNGNFHIATAHLVVKNGNFTLLLMYLVVKNGNFTLILASSGQEWQFHILLLTCSAVKNGNCTFLLTSSGQEWQFHIFTYILVVKNGNCHIFTDIVSRMAISHCYWHLVTKNGNFTLLLTSSGQEWQFHIATDI